MTLTLVKKPTIIVIGAGVAGMATGAYAQMSGFDSRIFEMHVLPGGCCTSWSRKGYIFDYCIEWLIGSGAGNDANQVWRELGALDGKRITNFEMFNRVVDHDGRSVTFYNDPARLRDHLIAVAPEDSKLTAAFCDDLERFTRLDLYPFLKPWPLMTWRERFAMLRKVLPVFRLFWRNAALPMERFCERLQNPLLRRAFPNIFFQDHECFPVLPYLYNLACAFNHNAGFPEGGSLGLSRSIEQRYLSLGGQIQYRAKVAKILVDRDRAVGVELGDGAQHFADVVVSACDGATTIYKMLGGRYVDPTIEKLYKDILHRPKLIYPGVVSVFLGVKGEVGDDDAHSTTYLLDDADVAALPMASQKSLVVQHRSRYSTGFAPHGKSVVHCTYFTDYAYWKKLRTEDRAGYRAEKHRVASFVQSFLERRYPGLRDRTEIVNVTSPATTERYTGNYNGSILAWKSFTEAEDVAATLVNKRGMQLPGLRGFYMAGQWVSGGGLIRAASSGRFAMQFICRDLKRPFRAWNSSEVAPWQPSSLDALPQLDDEPPVLASATNAVTAVTAVNG
jgi:phytoene dehydrogenase-like protein